MTAKVRKMAEQVDTAGVDGDLVRQLAELLEETGLSEIEYGRNGWHVRVARHAAAPAAVQAATVISPVPEPAEVPKFDTDGAIPESHPGLITSPMVGVAYTLPEEGADPFVRVGDEVTTGQSVMLVEAMKVFNPIAAPISGRVTRIMVANGTPVEYGEPLILIE